MHGVVGGPLDGGRFGHGVGLQLTEGCSLMPQDQTILATGMVLALEPVITLPDGQIMVHEENIVIGVDGAQWLSPRAPRMIPVLEG
jgi:Xaa-Pro aminopeptidase